MTQTDNDALVRVEQVDRDAAADIWHDYVARVGEVVAEKAIREGHMDDGLPTTLARHRLAALRSPAPPCPKCGGVGQFEVLQPTVGASRIEVCDQCVGRSPAPVVGGPDLDLLRLRFFRDIVNAQRDLIFMMLGIEEAAVDEANCQSHQRRLLDHLISQGRAPEISAAITAFEFDKLRAIGREVMAEIDAEEPTRPQPAQDEVEIVAKALGLKRMAHYKPRVRWPADKDDTLSGRDGTVPLTWEFAEECRADATAAITALRQHSGESALREENARLHGALEIISTGGFREPKCRQIAREALARAALGGGGE